MSKTYRVKISAITVSFCVFISTTAFAGGLYLSEFGTPSMGVAGAGSQAVASDASTAWYNPAGMTRLDGMQLMLSGGALLATVKFDKDSDTPIDGGNGGEAGSIAPVLGQFYTCSLTDRLKLGASIITITGTVLDYDNDWTGRFLNIETSLLTFTFNPTIAYRITNWISIGGGTAWNGRIIFFKSPVSTGC